MFFFSWILFDKNYEWHLLHIWFLIVVIYYRK